MTLECLSRGWPTAKLEVELRGIDAPTEVRNLAPQQGLMRWPHVANRDVRFTLREVEDFVGPHELHVEPRILLGERRQLGDEKARGQPLGGGEPHAASRVRVGGVREPLLER